jgi:hypothetical protein
MMWNRGCALGEVIFNKSLCFLDQVEVKVGMKGWVSIPASAGLVCSGVHVILHTRVHPWRGVNGLGMFCFRLL